MFVTKTNNLTVNNTYLFATEIPIKCPYCGAFVEPHPCNYSEAAYNDIKKIYLVTFHVSCCRKLFFATYLKTTGPNEEECKATLLNIYPPQKPENIPEAIKAISPRFVSLYNQAYLAETSNHFELAGSPPYNVIVHQKSTNQGG